MKFRQKAYTGKTEVGSRVIRFAKKHPVVPISTLALGVSSANLAVNTSRHKEAKKYQQDQLKAMESLTKALGKVDNSLQKGHEETAKDSAETEGNKLKRLRLFSIESGGYLRFRLKESNERIWENNLRNCLEDIADRSIFLNPDVKTDFIEELKSKPVKKETTEIEQTENSKSVTQEVQISSNSLGLACDMNSNPGSYTVSVFSKCNVLILYINKPSEDELKTLDNILDKYCQIYSNSDYISERISKNVYLVQVKLDEKGSNYLASQLLESGIKINILTEE